MVFVAIILFIIYCCYKIVCDAKLFMKYYSYAIYDLLWF